MNPDTQLPELTNEVERRVGRNLLLFQHVERILKSLLANARISGYANELDGLHKARSERTSGQTMGQLVGQYTEEVLVDAEPRLQVPQDLKGAWISFSFQIEFDDTFRERQLEDLRAIVERRNDLVHHFLQRWNPGSAESTRAALDYLDLQWQAMLPIRDHFLSVATDLQNGMAAHAAFLASEQGHSQLTTAWLQQSPLVKVLVEIAEHEGGTQGWTPLGTAGRLLRQREEGEVDLLLERYGHRTLKGLLLATDLFEVRDEATANGGQRAVYRLRSD